MKTLVKLVLLPSIAAVTMISSPAGITLVRDGQPQAVIIVPDELHKHVQKPAEQLASDSAAVPLAAVELADSLGSIGGKNKFCMCEACRALNPPEAPQIIGDSQLADPATKQPFAEYPSLSDRVFTFFNEIAARVGRELPDRDLVAYAYSVYRGVPVRVKQLQPSLTPELAPLHSHRYLRMALSHAEREVE